jgi:hypothetical protein
LRKENEQLFVVEASTVYSIAKDEEESDFSYEQRKWMAFKDTMTKIYTKKIRNLEKGNVVDLILALNEKEKKISIWLKREKSFLTEEDAHVMEILGVEIVGITVLRMIASEFYKMGNLV